MSVIGNKDFGQTLSIYQQFLQSLFFSRVLRLKVVLTYCANLCKLDANSHQLRLAWYCWATGLLNHGNMDHMSLPGAISILDE